MVNEEKPWKIFRLRAISEGHGSRFRYIKDRSESADRSLCTHTTVFWLLDNGIEKPGAECLLVEFSIACPDDDDDSEEVEVEFEHDGGRYTGRLISHPGGAYIEFIGSI
jgi:hypothetical protein